MIRKSSRIAGTEQQLIKIQFIKINIAIVGIYFIQLQLIRFVILKRISGKIKVRLCVGSDKEKTGM